MPDTLQMVAVLNLENIGEFTAGIVNTLLRGAETCVIHHRRSIHAGDHLPRLSIHNIKLGGLAAPNIQAMISRVERDRGQTFTANGPGGSHRALIFVDDFDGAVAANVDENAGARRI